MSNKFDYQNIIDSQQQTDIKEPGLYKVILLNDDITTMDFVVFVLMDIFNKSKEEAILIMLSIHHNQRGEAGRYPQDIANSKAKKTIDTAKHNGFPLKCVVEPVSD